MASGKKAEVKTKKNDASVSDFIESEPDERKRQDSRVLLDMMREATGEPPKMWGPSIVGYGSYHYKGKSGREGDWFLAGFSPRKQNLTLYLMAGIDGFPDLMARLGKHKTGKGCLYINTLADVDMDVLRQLIAGSVALMKKTNP